MSRLNLETLTTFSPLDAIVSPAVQETTPGGSDSFGALFERARSALSQPSSTASSTNDRAPARDSRVRENDGPTDKPQPMEDRASRETSDGPSEASPSDTAPAAEEQKSSETSSEAPKEPEAAEGTEVKSEDDSVEAETGEETSEELQGALLPADSNSPDGMPVTGTSAESESGEDAETPSDEESENDGDAAVPLVVAVVVDSTMTTPLVPPGETGVAAGGDPDMASGAKPAGPSVGGPILPKEAAGATGQPGVDPAAADAIDSTASADGASATEGTPTSQNQSEAVQTPPSEGIDPEGGQGEGNSDQTGDGEDRPSRRSVSEKSTHGAAADPAAITPSTSATGQSGVSPQVATLSQAGAAASQVASSVAATATGASASDTVPAESKGGQSGSSEVSGGQQAAQGQASRGAGTQASGDQSGVSQAERVRLVQRVARAFESVGDQGGTIRLRLHPAELGALRLEVTVRDGAMTARLEAETSAAQGLLLENLPALRERLAEQNIRVERFDVNVMGQSSGGTANGSDAQAQSGQGHTQQRPPHNDYRNKGVESGNEPRRAVTAGGTSRFDVIV